MHVLLPKIRFVVVALLGLAALSPACASLRSQPGDKDEALTVVQFVSPDVEKLLRGLPTTTGIEPHSHRATDALLAFLRSEGFTHVVTDVHIARVTEAEMAMAVNNQVPGPVVDLVLRERAGALAGSQAAGVSEWDGEVSALPQKLTDALRGQLASLDKNAHWALGVASLDLGVTQLLGATLMPAPLELSTVERKVAPGAKVALRGKRHVDKHDLKIYLAGADKAVTTLDVDVQADGTFSFELPLPPQPGLYRLAIVAVDSDQAEDTVATAAFYAGVEPPSQVDASLREKDTRSMDADTLFGIVSAWRAGHGGSAFVRNATLDVIAKNVAAAPGTDGGAGALLNQAGLLDRGSGPQVLTKISSVATFVWLVEAAPEIRARLLKDSANQLGVAIQPGNQPDDNTVALVYGDVRTAVAPKAEADNAFAAINRIRTKTGAAALSRDDVVEELAQKITAEVCAGARRADDPNLQSAFDAVLNKRRYRSAATLVLQGSFRGAHWRRFDPILDNNMTHVAFGVCSGPGAAAGMKNGMFGVAIVGQR